VITGVNVVAIAVMRFGLDRYKFLSRAGLLPPLQEQLMWCGRIKRPRHEAEEMSLNNYNPLNNLWEN